jgi:NAD(P)-dependent dehydrogenase (short-subunit alcohol dehydrogenase family)
MAGKMNDQIAVVTGSTRGFGYAIAQALVRAGATVVVSGRSQPALRKAVRILGKLGDVTGVACDVRRERQVYGLARQVVNRFGRIDVWVNNAGYSASAGRILETPPEEALDMFEANDLGTLHGTRAALRFMLERKQGTLVNIYGNGSFLRPASPTALYGATKAWVASFTRSLAKEIQGSGVRLVGFSPGMLLTDMLTSPTVVGTYGDELKKSYGFVLRLLAGSPEEAAAKLISVLESELRPFSECRLFKPWSPLAGLIRIGWENLTRTGKTPDFTLRTIPAYKPRI